MPYFTVAAEFGGKQYPPAKANSKKQAQQLAAENALKVINKQKT